MTTKGSVRKTFGPELSLHKTVSAFLDCVEYRTRTEFVARMSYSEEVPWFGEFKVADGIEPLKEIWDNLAEFKEKGKEEIQAFLSEHLK